MLAKDKRAGLPVDFDQIKVQLKDKIKTYLGIDVSFEQTQSNQAQRAAGAIASVPMNKAYLDEQLGVNADNPATIEDYVKGLIHYCTPNLFDTQDNRLDVQLRDFHTVDKLDNVVPYKNEHIHADMGEIEIDLSQMDKEALQVLYEDISSHPDQTLSNELLAQFKLERPDFKPRIDAKQFLQHVAYGEQDEAEALLQQDPQLAQELLQADGIPFTDYSGKTFRCTAYEYAYWAKDSHMQRMLEKYIRINEETRQLIEKRAQDITKPVPSAGHLGFLGGLFGPATEPQGLHYTTKDKQGNIIEHQDAGFDLAPLINALNHYVAEYNKKPNKTEADWRALEKIWIEKVGRAQRDVPAHIAQEYCHPDRSFDQVNHNKDLLDASNPANLKRQLKFYNYETGNYNVWFSPNSYSVGSGLGFSFGMVRGADGWQGVGGAGCVGVEAANEGGCVDSAALATIGKVRTKDREQSLLNLSQPLNLQESRSHGL